MSVPCHTPESVSSPFRMITPFIPQYVTIGSHDEIDGEIDYFIMGSGMYVT